MRIDDIRVFIPAKDYPQSQAFYQSLGFNMEYVSEALSLFDNGDCYFFLQRFYNQALAENLVLQISVIDIDEAWQKIIQLEGFDIRYQPIKQERWGKVIYLWGPSGELLQLTEFKQ
ncbi:lactoylglutathione lyase [Aliikangiella marina]|uniref:Lactoylglutathione lyase n=1 Tax=Aliikangiella marina TaxID=1712262 RepID=A0A545TA04_9GAMM|nr:lactoylglutathione lyase [Aliikangiella marina]TQV74038.1 lactoylglutathione lyase [Aliikangiella marina]